MKRGLEVNLCTKTYFFIRFNSSKSSSYMKLRVWLFFVCSYTYICICACIYIYVQMVCMMIYCIYRDGESSYRMYLSYICTYIREDDEYIYDIRYNIYTTHTYLQVYILCCCFLSRVSFIFVLVFFVSYFSSYIF